MHINTFHNNKSNLFWISFWIFYTFRLFTSLLLFNFFSDNIYIITLYFMSLLTNVVDSILMDLLLLNSWLSENDVKPLNQNRLLSSSNNNYRFIRYIMCVLHKASVWRHFHFNSTLNFLFSEHQFLFISLFWIHFSTCLTHNFIV